jgi:hypothetical protein
VHPTYSILVLMVLAVLRGLLFAVAWMTAIFSKSRARRKVAFDLVRLMLMPRRRRAPEFASSCREEVLDIPALADFHFHDLRHSGNTLAAGAGATLRELMDCMGHDSERAVMIYLHGSDAHQHQIADSLSRQGGAEARQQPPRRPGQRETIGHATGTQPEASLVKIDSESQEIGPDLGSGVSAPDRTAFEPGYPETAVAPVPRPGASHGGQWVSGT